jgi:uncharacterized protein
VLASLLVLALARVAGAEEDRDPAYRRLNATFVDRHVLPRYAQLAGATVALEAAAHRFCEAPSASLGEALRGSYQAAADAWQSVQHVQAGPISAQLRADRLAFWPDPRNATGRQLAELLAGRDPAVLTAERFARASAAVQGFPAVEHLLFDQGAMVAFQTGGDDASRRCRVLEAITRNVAGIAADVQHEWTDGDAAYARRIATAGPGNATFPEPKEATFEVLRSLDTGLEGVETLKLAKPLGSSLAGARPTLAEEWRSGRSLRNVRLNLLVLRALYLGEGAWGPSDFVREVATAPEIDARLRRGFDAAIQLAETIPGPLDAAVKDPRLRPNVERLLKEVRTLSHTVQEYLSTALDLPLGFNARDGD